jgi:hypothetical protein
MEGDGYTIHFNAEGEAIIDSKTEEGYNRGKEKLKKMKPAIEEYYNSGSHGKEDNKRWTPDKGLGDKYGLADVAGRHNLLTKMLTTWPVWAYGAEKSTRGTYHHKYADLNAYLRSGSSSKLKKKKQTKSKKNKKKLKKTKSKKNKKKLKKTKSKKNKKKLKKTKSKSKK